MLTTTQKAAFLRYKSISILVAYLAKNTIRAVLFYQFGKVLLKQDKVLLLVGLYQKFSFAASVFILTKHITEEQYIVLPQVAKDILEYHWARKIFTLISYEQFKKIPEERLGYLKNKIIYFCFLSRLITIGDILTLSEDHLDALVDNKYLFFIMIKQLLIMENFKQLSIKALHALLMKDFCLLLANRSITSHDLLNFADEHLDLFFGMATEPSMFDLLQNKKITGAQFASLNDQEIIEIFKDAEFRGLLNTGKITFEQFSKLSRDKATFLLEPGMCKKIATGEIKMETFIRLDAEGLKTLKDQLIITINKTLPRTNAMIFTSPFINSSASTSGSLANVADLEDLEDDEKLRILISKFNNQNKKR